MKIAVDAMGGDHGPAVVVPGAVQAARELGVEVVLVGQEPRLSRELARVTGAAAGIEVVHAAEAIGMGEGILSFRKKKHSSIAVAACLVRDSRADALVSMGNTAAVVYISKTILGAMPGVDRPALALLVPSASGRPTLLIDVGANANCQPHNLFQFAVMGGVFMESVVGVAEPRVGLMSIGEERGKGNDLVREAYVRLQAGPLNFIGNVESKDLFTGLADVIVSDGFTGNVALKAAEGVVENALRLARHEVTRNFFARLGFLLLRRHLKKLYKRLDYSEYGGAQLLGVNGVCVIGHGRSNANAVRNAILRAKDFVERRAQERLGQAILACGPRLKGAET
jgi:glycerol-3-phosphate acyltransferase PlsX